MLAALLDLAVPRRCAGCACPGSLVCPSCRAALAGQPVAHSPWPRPPGLPPLTAVAAYDGPVRALLIAHKERGRLGLTPVLGAAVASAAAGHQPQVLVPVPSSAAARRARGFDHTLRLARAAAANLRDVGVVPLLAVRRAVADSAGLSAAQRSHNLTGAFAADPRLLPLLQGRRVVVVDDLVTTGASLVEAARALGAAGIPVAGAAAVAATLRSSPASHGAR